MPPLHYLGVYSSRERKSVGSTSRLWLSLLCPSDKCLNSPAKNGVTMMELGTKHLGSEVKCLLSSEKASSASEVQMNWELGFLSQGHKKSHYRAETVDELLVKGSKARKCSTSFTEEGVSQSLTLLVFLGSIWRLHLETVNFKKEISVE